MANQSKGTYQNARSALAQLVADKYQVMDISSGTPTPSRAVESALDDWSRDKSHRFVIARRDGRNLTRADEIKLLDALDKLALTYAAKKKAGERR